MKNYKLILHGRKDCPYCSPYKEALERYDSTLLDEYQECVNYDEAVPRLTALSLGGKVLGVEEGVLDKYKLKAFLKYVESQSQLQE